MLENLGVSRIITLDIHSREIENCFDRTRLENLHASFQIIEKLFGLVDPRREDIVVLAGTGEFGHCGTGEAACVLDDDVTKVLRRALRRRGGVFGVDSFVQYFRSRRGSENLLYFRLDRALNAFERKLVDAREFPAAKRLRTSNDYVEGPRAFAEKRKPNWTNT